MIKQSELILNNDGTIFHLHLKPENIAEKIILVGDQSRVETVAENFEQIEFTAQNREFKTITGIYKGDRISVISTGIGTDNIDIVVNELDALVNIDLEKREIKKVHKSLKMIRIGTSGGLQANLVPNSFVVSEKSIGFDGMLHFYNDIKQFDNPELIHQFKEHTHWNDTLPTPYVVDASNKLLELFKNNQFNRGITISAPGFYGPQGRVLRLPLANPKINTLIETFHYKDLKISNYEMESSAIYGLAKMLGHEALTVCLIIANRTIKKANENYRPVMKKLIKEVLNQFIKA